MSDFLLQYEKIDPATFAVLASFLTISLFFKFNRFWSVRNLDILFLILFVLLFGQKAGDLENRFVDVVVQRDHERLKVLDDLMNVLGHTRDRLVLMYDAVDAEAPHR